MKFSLKRGGKDKDDEGQNLAVEEPVDAADADKEKPEPKAEKAKADKAKPQKKAKATTHREPVSPKEFLAQHGEKFGLAVIVMLFGYLVYSGYSVTGLDRDKTPEALNTLVSAARTHAGQDVSDQVVQDRMPELNYQTRVEVSRHPTDANPYQPLQPWTPLPPSRKVKRADPPLLKPAKIEVTPIFGAVATQKRPNQADALAELPAAPAVKVEVAEKPKPKPKPRTPRRGGEGTEDYASSMMMETDTSSMMMDYGTSMDGMGAGMTGRGRLLSSKYVRGWFQKDAGAGRGSAMMPSTDGYETDIAMSPAGGATAPGGMVPRTLPFNAITAVFPLEKQAQEFEQTLQDALGYEPSSDIPRIVYFEAQRVDVTDDPERAVDESEWTWVTDTNDQFDLQQRSLGGSAQSNLDPKFFDPAVTMPVPPLLMQNLDAIDLHSLTPKRVVRPEGAAGPTTEQETDPDAVNPLDPLQDPGRRRGPAARPAGPDGLPGGTRAPGSRGMGMGAPRRGAMGMGMPGAGMSDGEYGGGMGMGTGPGGKLIFPEYKLVRFYDFRIQPKRQYRYRVRLWIEDPNRPQDPSAAPPAQMLDDAVDARIRQVEAEDAKKTAEERTFWRKTDWSDPSPPVSVKVPENLFAGSVTTPNVAPVKVKDSVVEIVRSPVDEIEGDLVSLIWGGRYSEKAVNANADRYPTFIPGERRVKRGTVLNFKTDAQVVHPLTLQIKQIEEYKFRTDSVVVDIRGGAILPGEEKKDTPLRAPGEFAVIDDRGNFIVRNELDTIEGYRMYTFEDEKERLTASQTPAGGGMGEMPGMDDMMMPGMTDGGRPGRPGRATRGRSD